MRERGVKGAIQSSKTLEIELFPVSLVPLFAAVSHAMAHSWQFFFR